MPIQRIFTGRSRRQDMMLLSGWLFADLLLGLMTIFLVSTPPVPPHLPPTLQTDINELSRTDSHCSSPTICTITLNETASSQGIAEWAVEGDMSENIRFSPASGTLNPGQSTSITISDIPCQDGSFIFTGKDGISPVIVKWTCQSEAEKLEDHYIEFSLTNIDVQGILSRSSSAIKNIKQQIKSQSSLKGRFVGLAVVYGGAPNVNGTAQAQNIAGAIYQIMGSMQSDPTFPAFSRTSYYDNLFKLGQSQSIVLVHVYLFR